MFTQRINFPNILESTAFRHMNLKQNPFFYYARLKPNRNDRHLSVMTIGRVLCCSFIVNALYLCFLLCSRFSSLNTKLTWSCINRYHLWRLPMPRRLFSIKVRDNIISDISHVLLARKATLPQELPVTEILTQLSGYNVSCPGSKSPPPSCLLAPFLRGL